MAMRRCWKYDWKFCRHDGPCQNCEISILAERVKNSGKIMAQANNQYRNALHNLEKAKRAVERAKQDIQFALTKIGGRAARFYQVENEMEVQDADTGRSTD